MLDLNNPIYQQTAAYGHFGRTESELTWESTELAAEIKHNVYPEALVTE